MSPPSVFSGLSPPPHILVLLSGVVHRVLGQLCPLFLQADLQMLGVVSEIPPAQLLFVPFILPSQLHLKPAVKKPFGIKCNIYKHIKVLVAVFRENRPPLNLLHKQVYFRTWPVASQGAALLPPGSCPLAGEGPRDAAQQWAEPALCLALLAVVTAKGETGRVGTAASNCPGRPSGPGHIGVTTSTAEGNKSWSVRVGKTPRKS